MIIALLFAVSFALAAEMNSTSFVMDTATPSAGGIATGGNFVSRSTIEHAVGKSTSSSFILIVGFDFPLPFGEILNNTVTFVLEFNINGTLNDAAEVDSRILGNSTVRTFTAADISNFYACMEDLVTSGKPTYGIVFSGKQLSYINLSINTTQGNSFNLRLAQAQDRNKFVLPITSEGCANIRSKFQLIKVHGFMPQAFVPFFQGKAPIDIILSYPDIDIIGDFIKTGSFKLVIEKNETDTTAQIIARD